MSLDKFINYVNKTNESGRITDEEVILKMHRNQAVETINIFVNSIIDKLQKNKLSHTQFEFLHEGIAGLKYLDDTLLFYSENTRVITVLFNGNEVDKLIFDNNDCKIVSEKHREPLSNQLLEKYLNHFIK